MPRAGDDSPASCPPLSASGLQIAPGTAQPTCGRFTCTGQRQRCSSAPCRTKRCLLELGRPAASTGKDRGLRRGRGRLQHRNGTAQPSPESLHKAEWEQCLCTLFIGRLLSLGLCHPRMAVLCC